ncbi:MAG: DUF4224 domain-containing protein [Dechloromonas sp.]|nr:DUF4224 domain-containing protein [Dechloromonas sp.]
MLKAPLDGEALGAHEIARITGYALERDQVKWLTNNKWRFHLGGDGRPVLGRMYARLRLCGIDPELFFAR